MFLGGILSVFYREEVWQDYRLPGVAVSSWGRLKNKGRILDPKKSKYGLQYNFLHNGRRVQVFIMDILQEEFGLLKYDKRFQDELDIEKFLYAIRKINKLRRNKIDVNNIKDILRGFQQLKNKQKINLSKPVSEKMRRCHDCGKPTANYRCKACWDKIRSVGNYSQPDNYCSWDHIGIRL